MIEPTEDKHESGDPVQTTPDFKDGRTEFANRHHPPCIWKLQHETGNDKNKEGQHESTMLQALVQRHPDVEAVGIGCWSRYLFFAEPSFRCSDEIEHVVNKHPADDNSDQDEIRGSHQFKDTIIGRRRHLM